MKTAVTVLQELMTKLGKVPQYDFISQSGPQHQATFQYQCTACGEQVQATARSKKDAKQEVARLMLLKLAARGHSVPPPYCRPDQGESSGERSEEGGPAFGARSYVALLKELCEQYNLPAIDYTLLGDTGPPHLRHFTVAARVGQHERRATSTTKKAARQLAAETLYTYLREHLARVTNDFDEEEALVRVRDKAMERYESAREQPPWRPDLGQQLADYHLGLVAHCAEDKVRLAAEAAGASAAVPPDVALQAAVGALGLALEHTAIGDQQVYRITPTSPALSFFSAERALEYLRLGLAQRL